MPTVNLPHNITPGQPENASHVQANDVALRDAMNGTLDATNFATSAKPATLLGQWKTVADGWSGSIGGTLAGTQYWRQSGVPEYSGVVAGSTPVALVSVVAADHAVAGLTAKLRLQTLLVVNGVAPAINYTVGLYPVAFTGTGGTIVPTLGAVVSGTTTLFTTPAASSETITSSTEISLPSDGIYVLGHVLSGTVATNSVVYMRSFAQVRHIA